MQTLPAFLNIHGKTCLLVGSGEAAQRKRRLLEKAGAAVHAVAEQDFVESDLQGVALVVAASADDAFNQRISIAAQARSILVNVVDKPEWCTFIFPAIVERGAITVAVSSNGSAPVLTRLLRARIEALLPASLEHFAQQIAAFRQTVSIRLPDIKQRLRFWDQLLQRHFISADSVANVAKGGADFVEQLEAFAQGVAAKGRVAIVGAGTGDPDLLTFKALRCLQACDVVLADTDVPATITSLARRDAAQHTLQVADNVLSLLQDGVQRGEFVVYLLAGDPLARRDMSQLLMSLQAAGIVYDVVLGVIDQRAGFF